MFKMVLEHDGVLWLGVFFWTFLVHLGSGCTRVFGYWQTNLIFSDVNFSNLSHAHSAYAFISDENKVGQFLLELMGPDVSLHTPLHTPRHVCTIPLAMRLAMPVCFNCLPVDWHVAEGPKSHFLLNSSIGQNSVIVPAPVLLSTVTTAKYK